MTDIVVTTPLRERAHAAAEAADVRSNGGGSYFRVLSRRPRLVKMDRVFYVEGGYVRGYAVVDSVLFAKDGASAVCDTTGRVWDGNAIVYMDAKSWTWIKPIPMQGFRGWRYVPPGFTYTVVGYWLDPKPETAG